MFAKEKYAQSVIFVDIDVKFIQLKKLILKVNHVIIVTIEYTYKVNNISN